MAFFAEDILYSLHQGHYYLHPSSVVTSLCSPRYFLCHLDE